MKVAFLTPADSEIDEKSGIWSSETQLNVSRELMNLGMDVVRVSLNADAGDFSGLNNGQIISLQTLRFLTRFLERSYDYGLVFNFCGVTPLILSGVTQTPMITVLDGGMYQKAAGIYDDYVLDGNFIWCAVDPASNLPLPGPAINLAEISRDQWSYQIASDLFNEAKALLKRKQKEDHRPWGYYVILSDLDDHKVKRIVVYPHKRLSLQSHKQRSEHWLVVSGKGVVTLDSAEIELGPGESIDIPVGSRHRMSNHLEAPVVFIEVQTGEYFGEDDIERYEDDFGRV